MTFKIIDDDIVIDGSGNIEIIEGKDEIVQNVERCLTTNLGEFFLKPEHGLDYSVIKKKGYSIDEIKRAITQAILQEPAVTSVDTVTIEVDDANRSVAIHFTATADSEIITGEVVI